MAAARGQAAKMTAPENQIGDVLVRERHRQHEPDEKPLFFELELVVRVADGAHQLRDVAALHRRDLAQLGGRNLEVEGAGSERLDVQGQPPRQAMGARELRQDPRDGPHLALAGGAVGVGSGEENVRDRSQQVLFGGRRHRARTQARQTVRARRQARRRDGLASLVVPFDAPRCRHAGADTRPCAPELPDRQCGLVHEKGR
jgi:hypothetical protein